MEIMFTPTTRHTEIHTHRRLPTQLEKRNKFTLSDLRTRISILSGPVQFPSVVISLRGRAGESERKRERGER